VAVSSDSAATITVRAAWANDVYENFTDKDVDVVFQVNTNAPYHAGSPTKYWLQGSVAPLAFTEPSVTPGIEMKDDGLGEDETASDGIYTATVRFPACSQKNVEWKVVYDSTATDTVYECSSGQGNRSVYVNSDAFDTVGGTNGPLTLPARGLNHCTFTDKAIAVTFRVLMNVVAPLPGAGDTVAVAGGVSPLGFGPPPANAGFMLDDGNGPDETADDDVYSVTIVFPDSSNFDVNFKYWFNQWTNAGFECEGFGDRTFTLDDVNYSVGTPLVRDTEVFNTCTGTIDVPLAGGATDRGAAFAVLRQNVPNPASRALIHFDLRRAGRVSLRVYDISGRQVAELVNRSLEPGSHDVRWDGLDAGGRPVRSGIYFYELAMNGERIARRMVVAR